MFAKLFIYCFEFFLGDSEMPLFKKRKEEVPVEKFELPELPAFSEMQQIKEAIGPMETEPFPQQMPQQIFPAIQSPVRKEIERPTGFESERRVLTQEISEPIRVETETAGYRARSSEKMREPIFVKIDKFKDALTNFELIKEKLVEVDNLLKKIKETRTQEQQEFDTWEREIEDIKAKIESIDSKLFSKVE